LSSFSRPPDAGAEDLTEATTTEPTQYLASLSARFTIDPVQKTLSATAVAGQIDTLGPDGASSGGLG
jgi:hypothetical protein